jgi:hypothetical protein
MDSTQHDETDVQQGDLLVSRDPIYDFLVLLGMPTSTDVYYLKRSGWPIGSTAATGGKLIASKRRLISHIQKLTRGSTAA